MDFSRPSPRMIATAMGRRARYRHPRPRAPTRPPSNTGRVDTREVPGRISKDQPEPRDRRPCTDVASTPRTRNNTLAILYLTLHLRKLIAIHICNGAREDRIWTVRPGSIALLEGTRADAS